MLQLASMLGLSPSSALDFYDVYSLDADQLAHIPRPVLALLVIIPMNPAWHRNRDDEDAEKSDYAGFGPDEPVIWFKQTIGHACGSIGLLHCLINGPAKEFITPGSDLAKIRSAAISLDMTARAQMLYDNEAFETAHKSVQLKGDSVADPSGEKNGGHFVSFVKSNGRLWELEGSRKGPLDRGSLEDDEDLLSPRALDLGLKRIIGLAAGPGSESLSFSCIALAKKA